MDILKIAVDWTKAEMTSSAFFILFGGMFLATSFGFWQLGKTEVAKAYVFPAFIAGILLLVIGLGIFTQSASRVSSFPEAYDKSAADFIAAEINRANRVLRDYRVAVFRVIPVIIAVCAVLLLFLATPLWRASLIATIAMMAVILLIDTNAHARLDAYRAQLLQAQKTLP